MPEDARTTLPLPRYTGSRRFLAARGLGPCKIAGKQALARRRVCAWPTAPRGCRGRGSSGAAAPSSSLQRGPAPLRTSGLGANVKWVLFDRPYGEGKRRIESLALREARQAQHLLMHDRSRVTGAAVAEVVVDAVGSARPRLLPWLCRTRSHFLQVARRPIFATSGCGPAELRGAGLVAYIEEALDGGTNDALNALRLIGENAGWLVPHERTCWLSERPEVVRTDAKDRLHCASGPALRYRDGWSRFAWKGVIVPAWVIERPQDITLDWIDAQIDAPVRHAMIDIFTAERFIVAGGADPIARDLRGVLWSRTWTHRGTVIDSWRAVEYSGARRNGSSLSLCRPVCARRGRHWTGYSVDGILVAAKDRMASSDDRSTKGMDDIDLVSGAGPTRLLADGASGSSPGAPTGADLRGRIRRSGLKSGLVSAPVARRLATASSPKPPHRGRQRLSAPE